jgi:type I restriction enzyme S subunit
LQISGLDTMNSDAAVPGLNRIAAINQKIDLPPLPTQQKIAKILSNYDDLIENNLKRIKLLEESARLTYEEWFLRFCIDGKKLDIDPETKLPFGWQDVLLTDYIDLLRGVEPGSSKYEEVKTDSNIPFIRVGDLSKRDSDIYVSKDLANNKIIDKDDILLSLDGSPGKVRFGLSGCYSTGIRKAVSKQKNVSSIFIYNLLNSPYIQGLIEAYATGATILHAGSSVKKMRLVLPTDEVLDKYNNIEMKKFQLILNLSDEIKLLKEARDILLPRLMTGMIDTDDMDIAV